MSLKWTISAGLIDSATSASATFVVGAYAAWRLSTEQLGIYALFFSAIMFANAVPSGLLLQPAERFSLDFPTSKRLATLADTMKIGAAIATGASITATYLALVVAPPTSARESMPLAITALAAGILWPLQDHIRRLLHFAARPWLAVTASALNLVGVVGVVAAGELHLIGTVWVPFSAMAIGNLLSFLVVVRKAPGDSRSHRLDIRSTISAGRHYLAFGIAPALSAFVVSAIVGRMAGAAALGYSEAARIVAQPVIVVSAGLVSSIGPRSLEAGRTRNLALARANSTTYLKLILSVGIVCMAIFGWPWTANPLSILVPDAYIIPGLVAITILANTLSGLVHPYRGELLGAGLEHKVSAVYSIAAACHILVAFTASSIGAFTRPVALAAQATCQLLGHRHQAGQVWVAPTEDASVRFKDTSH